MKRYTRSAVDEVWREIEAQWEYHLATRAVFHSGLPADVHRWESPGYFQAKGIAFAVALPIPHSPVLRRVLPGVGHWLNQNYVIRLFGILDGHGLITAGRKQANPYTDIVAGLRHKVGAHSSGTRSCLKGTSRRTARLIQKHLDPKVRIEDINDFNLSVDTVLEPLKDHCIRFVQSMEGKPWPSKEPSCCTPDTA